MSNFYADYPVPLSLTSGTVTSIAITGSPGGVLGVSGSPITTSGTIALTVTQATTSTDGYLSHTDWNTFNNKQSTLTLGNLTDAGTDGITVTGGTGAVVGSGTSLSQHVADTTHNGYLSSTDWNTFNNKQSTLTLGNLTDAGTDGITVTGGTGAVVGSGTSLSQHVADTTHNGYLSSTDWNTFNSKQAAGNYITALTGDVTASGPGSAAATIASGVITNAMVNASAAIDFSKLATLTSGNILVGSAGNVATSVTMSGDATIVASGALTLAATNSNLTTLSHTGGVAINGTNANTTPGSGQYGQRVSSAITSPTNFPTSTQYGDLTSISLTAGYWELSATIGYNINSSTTTAAQFGISTTAGNDSTGLSSGDNFFPVYALADNSGCIAGWVLSLNTTTTVYFKYRATYSVGTPQANGRLTAWRRF